VGKKFILTQQENTAVGEKKETHFKIKIKSFKQPKNGYIV
jgi:hypothetical protein